jgi:hypothetical protein
MDFAYPLCVCFFVRTPSAIGAVGLARVQHAIIGALKAIGGAVVRRQSLKSVAHSKLPGFQVDISPPKGQGLALADAKRYGDGKLSAII